MDITASAAYIQYMALSLIFDYLEISGFMSFPPNVPQRISLDTGHLTTILGENLDIGDGERNGVGKTAILDALLYLYFGKSPRMSNQGFLNYIEPGPLFVSGAARRDGIAFYVERGEAPSVIRLFEKPDTDSRDFRHMEAGKLIFETTKANRTETGKRVVELIGFDLKLGEVLLFNNPADRSCFFLKSEEEQRNLVERIFGFTIFSEKAERLKELRHEESKNLTAKESALVATRQANDRILAQVTDLETKSNAWAVERDKTVKFVVQQINSYKDVDFDHEIHVLTECQQLLDALTQAEQETKSHEQSLKVLKQKHDLWTANQNQLVEGLTAAIEKGRTVDATTEINTIKNRSQIDQDILKLTAALEAGERERQPYQTALGTAYANRMRLVKQIAVTEQEIAQLYELKCPKCGQDWADTKDHVGNCAAHLDNQNAELQTLDTTITELMAKIKKINNEMDKMAMKVTGLQKTLHALPVPTFQTVEEATRASSSLAEQQQRLQDARTAQNPHTEILEQIVARIADCHVTREELQQKITSLPATSYDKLQQAVHNQQRLKNLQQQLFDLQQTDNPHRDTIDNLRTGALTPVDDTEIKRLQQQIEHIELLIELLASRNSPIRKAILQEWLPELNRRVNAHLESLELPHRITFDANMTATFSLDGKPLAFGNLSTGQRLRVWLATNLSLREIFELIYYKINLFFVDEVLDKGMSARGAEVSFRLLEKMVVDRSVYLITHRSELVDMAYHTMTVTLENGLSTINTD